MKFLLFLMLSLNCFADSPGRPIPSQVGNAGKYLKTDGSHMSWNSVSGGSAPSNFIFSNSTTQDWDGAGQGLLTDPTLATRYSYFGSADVPLLNTTKDSGDSIFMSGSILEPTSLHDSGEVDLKSGDNYGLGNSSTVFISSGSISNITNAAQTGQVQISTGQTNGSGNTGPITLNTGTVSGGTRGKILLKDGSEGTAGHIWTEIAPGDGSGHWAAIPTLNQNTSGNAATATALAADPADCAANTYATAINASGTLSCGTVTNAGLAGSIAASKLVGTDIATVGTITAGTWTGTSIASANGGTSTANSGTLTFSGTASVTGANTGDVAMAAVGASPSANGASISGQTLTLQPADGTHPGVVTTAAQTFAGAKTFSSAPNFSSLTASQVLDLDGSGNVTTIGFSSTASASLLVQRDANISVLARKFISSLTSTATAAATTTLAASSNGTQIFTGSTTQTVVLPVVTTLNVGTLFKIRNRSSGIVTVQSSGTNTVKAMAAGSSLDLILTANGADTTAAPWDVSYHTD